MRLRVAVLDVITVAGEGITTVRKYTMCLGRRFVVWWWPVQAIETLIFERYKNGLSTGNW